MMTKNKSNQIRKAKYLLLLPLLASMLIYTSCETNQVEEVVEVQEVNSSEITELSTVTLDEVVIDDSKVLEVLMDGKFSPLVRVFISKNFNRELIKNADLKSSTKIMSTFIVDVDGSVKKVNVFRAPNQALKDEILRIIKSLPKTQPAMKEGKPIARRYTLPITLVDSETSSNQKFDVPFAVIENVPVFPGCTGTRKEKSDCLNSSIRKVVARNFNGDLAKITGLSKGKKKIWVQFRIDEQGNVGDIKAFRAPNSKLGEEAERVVKLLPKMEPGKQRGKTVGMKYTLPISFVVE